jgi:hypothetical protein
MLTRALTSTSARRPIASHRKPIERNRTEASENTAGIAGSRELSELTRDRER